MASVVEEVGIVALAHAEGMHYLKDDVPNTIMLGDDESGGTKVAVKKNLYFFCNNQDELFAELDRKLSIPLIPEFKDYFISELQDRNATWLL